MLQEYCKRRFVVLAEDATAFDAARAMEDNHVGAVIVSDGNDVVGIVTDRDLALRVIGQGRNPAHTSLSLVMTTDVATLPTTSSELSASKLMLEQRVRRAPIVHDGRLVGMVTLDDLIINQNLPQNAIAAIVKAQLAEPSKLKAQGAQNPSISRKHADNEGHDSRAAASYRRMVQHLLGIPDLHYEEEAGLAIEVVLSGILERITPEEAEDLRAQLPAILQDRLGNVPRGPNRAINKASIEETLQRRLGLEPWRAASLLNEVARMLGYSLSDGEIEDIRGQLPPDLKSLFVNNSQGARG